MVYFARGPSALRGTVSKPNSNHTNYPYAVHNQHRDDAVCVVERLGVLPRDVHLRPSYVGFGRQDETRRVCESYRETPMRCEFELDDISQVRCIVKSNKKGTQRRERVVINCLINKCHLKVAHWVQGRNWKHCQAVACGASTKS